MLAEAPGRDENRLGQCFVGKAGGKLDGFLAEVDLTRDDVLLMNMIRCQPPRNRINSREGTAALAACAPWTVQEMAAYNPGVVMVMGKTALATVFMKDRTVGSLRGTVRHTGEEFSLGSRTWVATAHPAASIYDKSWGPLIVEDLRLGKELLDG